MPVDIELNPRARKEIEEILERADKQDTHVPYAGGYRDRYNPNFRQLLQESVEYVFGKYPYKPTLDVFVTEQYTAEGAWAHTEPERKVVCIRPHERLGYDLFSEHPWAANIPFGIVAVHEVSHNAYPGANEGSIRRITSQPDARYVLDGFNLKYHGRN